uniref:Uncharacterized protein n=2 Tax=Oryza nivara TaxID=4536 RepID=A0A0E0IUU0_ORYNI
MEAEVEGGGGAKGGRRGGGEEGEGEGEGSFGGRLRREGGWRWRRWPDADLRRARRTARRRRTVGLATAGGAVKVMAAASQWTTFLVPLRPARVDLLPGNAGCRPSWLDLPALVYDGTKFCNGVVLGTIGVGAILCLLPQPTSTCLQGTCACTVYLSLRSYCEGGDISLQASVKVLKEVTKTRKVPVLEVPLALTKIKKANLETSSFFETLRGTEFPVRTWMRIFVKN